MNYLILILILTEGAREFIPMNSTGTFGLDMILLLYFDDEAFKIEMMERLFKCIMGISALSRLVYLKGLSTKSREEMNNEIE